MGTKKYNTIPQTKETIQALWRLEKIILHTLDFKEVVQRIVDGLLDELGYLDLGYRIIVLTLVNEEKKVLERISLSQTDEARRALEASAVPFKKIEIPLRATKNDLIKTLRSGRPHIVHRWPGIFTPVLTSEQALANQTAAGIKTSMLYPVIVRDKPIGVLIFSMVKDEEDVSEDEKELIRGFTDIVGLAVENSRLYSSLGETSLRLRDANKKLKELDQMKDDFVSVASHELRTPMTAIKSYLWMALAGKGGALSQKQKYYLNRAYVSTDRLIKLVNDMLNISRIESGRISVIFGKVAIVELAKDVVEEVLPHAKDVQVDLRVLPHVAPEQAPPGGDCADGLVKQGGKHSSVHGKSAVHALTRTLRKLTKPRGVENPYVTADAEKIKEVMFNLIGNALKFTQPGGHVHISFTTNGDMVTVHVADDGRGIAAENFSTLFTKFGMIAGSYATNKKASGTGLGLYISKEIVALHGGTMTAQSEGIGKGSTFSFSLPLYTKASFKRMSKKTHKGSVDIIHSGF